MVEDTCNTRQRFVKGAWRVPRSHVSPELLARAPRSRFASVHRVPHFYAFSACYTGFLALYTKHAIISVLLFVLDKFWRNLSALIRFLLGLSKGNARVKISASFLFFVQPHSRPQRPRSFWSSPRIATSGQVQHRKSAIHGLPVPLRMFRFKFDKSDWFWSQSIVFTKPFKNGMPLD